MKDLGVKLEKEMRPGSYVVSNVFAIEGWRPVNTGTVGMYIYRLPESLQEKLQKESKAQQTAKTT